MTCRASETCPLASISPANPWLASMSKGRYLGRSILQSSLISSRALRKRPAARNSRTRRSAAPICSAVGASLDCAVIMGEKITGVGGRWQIVCRWSVRLFSSSKQWNHIPSSSWALFSSPPRTNGARDNRLLTGADRPPSLEVETTPVLGAAGNAGAGRPGEAGFVDILPDCGVGFVPVVNDQIETKALSLGGFDANHLKRDRGLNAITRR